MEPVRRRPSLKDVWAAYRKKEVLSETPLVEPVPVVASGPATITTNEEVVAVSLEAEQIGDKVVKVTFSEVAGRWRRKVTQAEVKQADLEQVIEQQGPGLAAQFNLF